MTKYLILGGAGYIGSNLVKYIFDDYLMNEVTVFDRLLYDKTSLLQYVNNLNFRFVKGDVRNFASMDEEIKKHDVIIPLAALVGAPLCDKNPVDAKLVNFEHVKYVVDKKSKNQIIIYPNSNSGYGQTDGTSLCTEETPMKPVSLYGSTKLAAEEYIKNNCENYLIFRLATVFGPSPRMRTDLLVNNLVLKAMKEHVITLYESHYMRNYVHIDDVCRAFMFGMNHHWEQIKNNVYNLGNDKINMSKLDLVKRIKHYIPLETIFAEYTKDTDQRNYIVSSQKFYNKGFYCFYGLDEGIKALIKTYEMIDEPVYANY